MREGGARSERGRTALVTGAARGIGASIAHRLASQGHRVVAVDVDATGCAETVAHIREAGGQAWDVVADATDEATVVAVVEDVAHRRGPPAVLVNNAGFARPAPLVEMSVADWDAVLDVTARAAFLWARETAPYMIAGGWGRIVNVSSTSALGDPGRVSYASGKAALIGFTRTLAEELGTQGVTVNAVAPGFVVTAMTRLTAERLGRPFAEHARLAASSTAVRRVGQPEDVANAVAFFVDDCAGYVSGQVLFVSGGPVG